MRNPMPALTSDRETFRYRSVEKHITQMIQTGALGLGDRLPSLRKLSTNLGMSISTINQAYLELERKGIIESRPRSGFSYAEIPLGFRERKNLPLP